VEIHSLPAVVGRSGKDAKPDLDLARWDTGKLISRRHAVILAAGEGFVLRAEKTTNGTFLNGEEIPPGTERPLRDGDRIQFGYRGVEWTFRAGRA
jgi:pSer/pThr/pTyr-binding forkhead associated (FHA) protein